MRTYGKLTKLIMYVTMRLFLSYFLFPIIFIFFFISFP